MAKKTIPIGQKALQAAVLNNVNAEKGGSSFIMGYVSSQEERQQITRFLEGKGFLVRALGTGHYNMTTRNTVHAESLAYDEAVPIYKFSVATHDRIDVEKFERDFDVAVFHTSALKGDVATAQNEHSEALYQLALANSKAR